MSARVTPAKTPLLLVVTGPPASGKTKVARELARRLRVPFVVKDTFKERLYETFGSNDGLEEKIDDAALAMLFSVVDSQLEAGVSVVAESNFDSDTDTGPFRDLCRSHDVRVLQIHCTKPPQEIEEEFAERAASGRRHPGHRDSPDKAGDVRDDVEAGRWDPLDLPGKLIQLDIDELDYETLVGKLS
jgi:predicted kinase